jgi:hypothetical protein
MKAANARAGNDASDSANRGLTSGQAFRLSKGRNSAELLHHAKRVPIAVGIHDFPVSDVVDSHTVNRYFLIRGWNSHELASVSASDGPAGNYFIVLGDEILDGPVEIRVARKEEQQLALVGFRAYGHDVTRDIGGLESVAGGDELTYKLELAFVPNFFIEAPNDGFVLG